MIDKVKELNPDLINLDILMPRIDGVELYYKLRKFTDTPIVFMSCKSEDVDKVIGLSDVGDDYITKQFPN